MKNFTIAIPVFNDWDNLNRLLKKINLIAKKNSFEFNILIINDFSTTGDAIISSLQVLSLMIEKNKPISELTNLFTLTKQINHEIKIGKKNISNKTLEDLSLKMREKIGSEGRLIIRKSGTEPLIRIMVETDNHELGNKLINEIKSSLDFLS